MRSRDGSAGPGVRMYQMRSLALVALVGCSFATTGAPSPYDGRTPPDCTTSSALPLLDTAATVLLGAIGLQMALAEDSCRDDGSCEDPHASGIRRGGYVALGLGAVYAVGAVVGFKRVSSCGAAVRTYEALHRTGAR